MNDGFVYREVIGPRGVGREVVNYLSGRYRHSSVAQWREHLAAGRVIIAGTPAAEGDRLRVGDQLEWHRPAWTEPAAPLELPVLYAERGMLVVDKPSGLPTMPGGGFLQNTLLHQLRLSYPDASPMHRLGRWTSGAVVCSLNSVAGASLAAQFAARDVGKRYRALASGTIVGNRRVIDVAIGPVPYPPLGTLHAADDGGRASSSTVTVLERRSDSTLCDVVIATGRPHQIRIHLAWAGHPLVGDPLYAVGGLPAEGGTALPGDPGYHLHAAEIAFAHAEGDAVVVKSPVPPILGVSGEQPSGWSLSPP